MPDIENNIVEQSDMANIPETPTEVDADNSVVEPLDDSSIDSDAFFKGEDEDPDDELMEAFYNDDSEVDDDAEPNQTDKNEPTEETETTTEPETLKYTLKHLDETAEYTAEEMIPLAQKGMDYDRIREGYDIMAKNYAEGQYALEVLESMKGDFGSVSELIDDIVARNILTENGADINDATLKSVMSSAKSKREEAKKNLSMTALREANYRSKRDAEVSHFSSIFPKLSATDIPQEVWDDMNKNDVSLIEAYLRSQNTKLTEKVTELEDALKTEKSYNKNKSKSVGSAKSTMKSEKMSSFMEGALEDDLW